MLHTPKNQTTNKTESWIRERQRLTDFYNKTPFFGEPAAKQLYETLKKAIPSIIQVSKCGVFISVTTYKQDGDRAAYLLNTAFKTKVKQTTCPFTDFVTTSLKTI